VLCVEFGLTSTSTGVDYRCDHEGYEMRAIATIATIECLPGLQLLVSSLRRRGWTDPVNVFVPAGLRKFDLPEGCVQHRLDNWWDAKPPTRTDPGHAPRRHRTTLEHVCNVPALGKPDVFLSFKDGDEVLYLDGADVLVLENPMTLLDLFEASGKALGAHPYEPAAQGLSAEHPDQFFLARLLASAKLGQRYNDGVILARMDCRVRLFMHYWKMVLGHAAYLGTFVGAGARRTVVGDQVAFNICIGSLGAYGEVWDFPKEWNYRGYANVNLCQVNGDGLFTPDGTRVLIAHASGSRSFRSDIAGLGR